MPVAGISSVNTVSPASNTTTDASASHVAKYSWSISRSGLAVVNAPSTAFSLSANIPASGLIDTV